jgi:hypothetical protein
MIVRGMMPLPQAVDREPTAELREADRHPELAIQDP